jgi:1D-myo-inositol 3-kinase
MHEAPIDILVVGNPCHDTLLSQDGSEHHVLGGSASYISAILRALGASFRTLAKVGADFRYRSEAAFEPIVEGARSCSFVDDYRSGERKETLQAAGPRIEPGDVEGRYRIAIACAVAGEVLPETLLALRSRADLILADAQGLVRAFGPNGEVRVQPLLMTPFATSLHTIDWLKIGANELACIDPAELRANLLFTDGPRGTLMQLAPNGLGRRDRQHIAPYPATERDATGAGDCFLAGFAYGLVMGFGPEKAAKLGNFCGARAVEVVGVPTISTAQIAEAIGAF